MATVEIGQTWVGNVDGTAFEIVAVDPPWRAGGRPYWIWRTEAGQTGTASTALITHACTLTKEN